MAPLSTTSRIVVSLALLALGIGGFLWLGTPEVVTRPPEREDAPVVRTVPAQQHNDGIQFEVDGVVVPFRQIEIAAQVGGRIEFKADQCRTGRAVQKGDLLLRIDQRDYELEVARLREELIQADAMLDELDAEIASADHQIESIREQLKIDMRLVERNKDLLTKRAASDSEVDLARRTELMTQSSLQTLLDQKLLLGRRRLRLESAKTLGQANLEVAELSLARTEIRSPLDGVVVSENVEQGGYVQAGSTVISLQDTSSLDVTCKLHMQQMHWLWQSQSELDRSDAESRPGSESGEALALAYDFPETAAIVSYELAGRTYQWHGVLNRYDGAGIDSQTRMVPCRVHVSDPLNVTTSDSDSSAGASDRPPTLMTGMFVKVRVDARPPIPLVRLPQQAVQPGNSVWTVDAGKLHRKQIRVATSDPRFVVAYQQQDGLQADDAVVVSPLANPFDGLAVTKFSELKPRRAQPASGAGSGGRPDRREGRPQ